MRFLHPGLVLAFTLVACKPPEVTGLPDADVRVSDERVTFTPTYVGYRDEREVTFSNFGGRTADVALNVEPPFFVEPSNFQLARGADQRVRVTFAPMATGLATAAMQGVALEGEGLAVPECGAAAACTTSRFDGQQCVEENRPNGTGCETNCIVGQCNAGTCVGSIKGCATNDACLVPTCDEQTGCGSAPRMCPEPTSPCQVATCDSATGCGFTDALDGTLCGDDDCFATQVNVCITGQCVLRPRPVTAQCSNRWVPNTFPARGRFATAYDVTRARIVVFAGQSFDDTWTRDGSKWELRLPVSAPTTRRDHAMTWDPVRKRVLLFGGLDFTTGFDETWEWDGLTWLRRNPSVKPPAGAASNALAWDHARRRAVLFLGNRGTWEWDGVNWAQRASDGGAPGAAFSIAWDGLSRRVVLFGGLTSSGQRTNSFWEWDGTTWTERGAPAAAPAPRYGAAMTWDPLRRRIVLFGGGAGAGPENDTWEWDGSVWLRRTPATSPPGIVGAELLYDEARQRSVLLTGLDDGQWEWDGTNWAHVMSTRPPIRSETAMTTDSVRKRVVQFGGRNLSPDMATNETWEWDGTVWSLRTPATSPPPRHAHSLGYDALHGNTVLFGGVSGTQQFVDTWVWDGTDWQQRTPSTSPPPGILRSMVWDPLRQRTWLTGTGDPMWSWDGTTWTEITPVSSPASMGSALAWDDVQQRVLLQNAGTWSWDGTTWAQHAGAPPWRSEFAMGTDFQRKRVLYVVRGQLFSDPFETWEWDGATWTQRHPVARLPSAVQVMLTWDPVRERVMAMVDGTVWHFLP